MKLRLSWNKYSISRSGLGVSPIVVSVRVDQYIEYIYWRWNWLLKMLRNFRKKYALEFLTIDIQAGWILFYDIWWHMFDRITSFTCSRVEMVPPFVIFGYTHLSVPKPMNSDVKNHIHPFQWTIITMYITKIPMRKALG